MKRLWHRFLTGHWPQWQPFHFDSGSTDVCRTCLLDAYCDERRIGGGGW